MALFDGQRIRSFGMLSFTPFLRDPQTCARIPLIVFGFDGHLDVALSAPLSVIDGMAHRVVHHKIDVIYTTHVADGDAYFFANGWCGESTHGSNCTAIRIATIKGTGIFRAIVIRVAPGARKR